MLVAQALPVVCALVALGRSDGWKVAWLLPASLVASGWGKVCTVPATLHQ